MKAISNTIEACCLQVEAIPEGFAGTLTIENTDQAGPVATVNVQLYQAGHSQPAGTTGSITAGGALQVPFTSLMAQYADRYAKKLVLKAYLTDGTLINFQDATPTDFPGVCMCIDPCINGLTTPTEVTLAEYVSPCPGCCS